MDHQGQRGKQQFLFDPKKLIEFFKAIFGRGSGPKDRVHKLNPETSKDLQGRMTKASDMMKKRSIDLAEKDEYFKAFVLDARAEQLSEMSDYLSYATQKDDPMSLDPEKMAGDLKNRLEKRIEGFKDTELYNNAQKDFARLLADPDEMLKLDQDIVRGCFDERNPAHSALVRCLNGSSEELSKQMVEPPKSAAEANDMEVRNPSIWDHVPDHAKTSVEEARRERAQTGDRPNNIAADKNDKSGFEHGMPDYPEDWGMG